MNLLACNLLRSGFPAQNVPQKRQFHHAANPSLHNLGQTTKKHFENPNLFHQKPLEKNIPSSYKHSDLSKDTNQLNSSDMITEKAKTNSDSLLIEAVENICTKTNVPKMEASGSKTTKEVEQQPENSESELSESDDSFIVFQNAEVGSDYQEDPVEGSESDEEDLVEGFESDEEDETDSDSSLIEAPENICTKINVPKMEASGSCTAKKVEQEPENSESELSESDDSFIVFQSAEGGSDNQEDPVEGCESDEEDDSSSECDDDSDESFIDYNDNKKTRGRKPSVTESEDSFIVFEGADGEETEDEDIESNDEEDTENEEEEEVERRKCKPDNGKKVTFAEGPALSTVHVMIKWNFAYRKARKGLWEQYARDNERFKLRACQFGATMLNKFLVPEHRLKVYEERFKDRQD